VWKYNAYSVQFFRRKSSQIFKVSFEHPGFILTQKHGYRTRWQNKEDWVWKKGARKNVDIFMIALCYKLASKHFGYMFLSVKKAVLCILGKNVSFALHRHIPEGCFLTRKKQSKKNTWRSKIKNEKILKYLFWKKTLM